MKSSSERKEPYDKIIEALGQIQNNNDEDFNDLGIRIYQLEDKNRRLVNYLESIINILKD